MKNIHKSEPRPTRLSHKILSNTEWSVFNIGALTETGPSSGGRSRFDDDDHDEEVDEEGTI